MKTRFDEYSNARDDLAGRVDAARGGRPAVLRRPCRDRGPASRVSYWDVNHFGRSAAIAEALLFVGCYAWVMKKHDQIRIRAGATLLAIIYLGFIALAVRYWVGL
jgi:hypothetical protein